MIRTKLCDLWKRKEKVRVVKVSAASATVRRRTEGENGERDIIDVGGVCAADCETTLRRVRVMTGELEVHVMRQSRRHGHSGLRVRIRTNIEGDELLLHWGISDAPHHAWRVPPKQLWPSRRRGGSHTQSVNQHAVETRMWSAEKTSASGEGGGKSDGGGGGGEGWSAVELFFDMVDAPPAISFVIKDNSSSRWHNNGGPGWRIPLAETLPVHKKVEDRKTIFSQVAGLDHAFSVSPKDDDEGNDFNEFSSEESASAATENAADTRMRTTAPHSLFDALPFLWEAPADADENLVNDTFSLRYDVVSEHTIRARLIIDDEGQDARLDVSTTLPDTDEVFLHWGVRERNGAGTGAHDTRTGVWQLPEKKKWPEHTIEHRGEGNNSNERALRTRLLAAASGGGDSSNDGLRVRVKLGLDPAAVYFVLHNTTTDQWYSLNGGNFHVPLPDVIVEGDKRHKQSQRKPVRGMALSAHGFDEPPKWRIVLPANPMRKRKVEVAPFHHSAAGHGAEIILQGFNWESWREDDWYAVLRKQSDEIDRMGFSIIWMPPPTDSVSRQGYLPRDLYDLDSEYGKPKSLKATIREFKKRGMHVLCDCVLNHRCAHFQDENGVYNKFGGRLDWDASCVVGDDPNFRGTGHRSTGQCFFTAAPTIDHENVRVRRDIAGWIKWLMDDFGYSGFRIDFARGFGGRFVKEYIEQTEPHFSVGEFWDSLEYGHDGRLAQNQDHHRRRILDWIHQAGGLSAAFDVTTKGILHEVFRHGEFWRLRGHDGKPAGLIGLWPSRAVTFLENHDTGSTQQHWPFPRHHVMEGYAYILTHPGTPTVFYDHVFGWGRDMREEIQRLIACRIEAGIDCHSPVNILQADSWVYAAEIGGKLTMKIGPGSWSPAGNDWKISCFGHNYATWTWIRKT